MGFYLINFFLGFTGAWTIQRFGTKIGLTDIPSGRSSHNAKICKGGGIGVLFALLFSAFILGINHFLWLPALVISVASFWGGDKHKLSVKERLIIHSLCSFYFLFFFFFSKNTGLSFYLLSIPLTVFIVGTSNFYNFMDGIDGIAAITGCAGFSLLAYYGWRIGADSVLFMFCIAVAFSCFGFLCLNFPKAKVFLGDLGSILIGFVFACFTIVLSEQFVDFIIMIGFLFPFYIDELSTMFIRLRDGEQLVIAHRRHIYQLLANELEMPHWIVSSIYGVSQLIIGLTVIAMKPFGSVPVFLVYLVFSSLFLGMSYFVRKKVKVK